MVADIVSGVLGLTKPSTAVEVMTDFLLEGAGVVASRAGAGSVNVFQEGFRNVPPQKVSDSLAQIEKRLDAKDFADNQDRDRLLKLRKLLREVQQAEKKK
jgi:hypothetical protein